MTETKMSDSDDSGRFQRSLERASMDPRFMDIFYDGFMGSSDEVAAIFRNADMERLKRKLKASLHVISLAATDAPGTRMYLEYLGKVHGKMDIQPHLYTVWLESLISAVSECDPDFDVGLEATWRALIGDSVRVLSGHRSS